uniref:Uncharacterized protein n=1 Tax=Arcella intermedia TaxID=1963864 RepID=A0A6B2LCY5_9EUKA
MRKRSNCLSVVGLIVILNSTGSCIVRSISKRRFSLCSIVGCIVVGRKVPHRRSHLISVACCIVILRKRSNCLSDLGSVVGLIVI